MSDADNTPFFAMVAPKDFRWEVKVPVPANGRYVFATFTGVFAYRPLAELDEWLAPGGQPRTDADLAAEALLAVEDVRGEDGGWLPSTPELKARMLAVDRVPLAVVTTYLAALRGVAATKN